MAMQVLIQMKRTNPSGIVCTSTRMIVLWGKYATREVIDAIESSLYEVRQISYQEKAAKTQTDYIREVCNKLAPGHWDFLAQAGSVEF